ncbi:MAG: tRNA (guanosine(18)-2'-O)-methyltransferase TrmH [Gammaproteobacteria bacterium]|jgi:tRNA (guanosine-2'-O-)-methyltransferase|nr:tRNA (guanosine(18)-2'-O)-methyltransferase TrmH [Gammaproteobacteria bacterium]MDP6616475.1 tRNA (guanosine(18)-2'-O)-methyltransferase TrmH [Gammaproteobacteria bacterium]MDP6694277.1 tRNA (guanosine(18)-2'-O)-methyltransferase TrmH [Gammaproteobacteria bacterium]MDP7041300.1 tRNA (guanosine(18)-2'-O)-methyltransferase TrmH [Gammaproteobacteria bacterium]
MTPERFRKIRVILDRRQPDLTVIADNFRKSHNVAALVRTCDAVGVYRLHVVSPDGESKRHHMVAAGTHKWVHTAIHTDVATPADNLRATGFRIVAAHPGDKAKDYRDIDYTVPTAVVLGSELTGVCRMTARLADEHVMIPMRGMAESLNVSVANALILYEAARQREAAGLYDASRLDTTEYRQTLFEWCYPDIARRCREHGVPYPDLDDEGLFHHNPLPGAA